MVDIGLFTIIGVVLAGPLLSKHIERNLEAFLLVMGIIAASVSWVWSLEIVRQAITEPVLQGIVPAVLIAGAIFHYGRGSIDRWMKRAQKTVSLKVLVFSIIVGLGLLSSVITAIIAALLLVELVHFLPLDRKNRVELTIIACFSIGFGAALTPIGEPLSVIAITALKGEPYHADFFFLMRNLGIYIIPGVLFFGVLGVLFVRRSRHKLLKMISLPDDYLENEDGPDGKKRAGKVKCPACGAKVSHGLGNTALDCPRCGRHIKHIHQNGKTGQKKTKDIDRPAPETLKDVLVRGLKVYIFVIALILLGKGMSILVEKYFTLVPPMGLYWLNIISAVLDNATLTAAEIGPKLGLLQIKMALMALLISGGMMVPGNIPNIISAHKLKIKSKEWARVGLPLGLAVMVVYFIWLVLGSMI